MTSGSWYRSDGSGAFCPRTAAFVAVRDSIDAGSGLTSTRTDALFEGAGAVSVGSTAGPKKAPTTMHSSSSEPHRMTTRTTSTRPGPRSRAVGVVTGASRVGVGRTGGVARSCSSEFRGPGRVDVYGRRPDDAARRLLQLGTHHVEPRGGVPGQQLELAVRGTEPD